MALRDYARYFRSEDEDADEEAVHMAREILDWVSLPYHERFLAWLDKQASKPIKITSDNLTVVELAVRANTYREIREHMKKLTANAQATLAE